MDKVARLPAAERNALFSESAAKIPKLGGADAIHIILNRSKISARSSCVMNESPTKGLKLLNRCPSSVSESNNEIK